MYRWTGKVAVGLDKLQWVGQVASGLDSAGGGIASGGIAGGGIASGCTGGVQIEGSEGAIPIRLKQGGEKEEVVAGIREVQLGHGGGRTAAGFREVQLVAAE
ncbi:hypothetical protein AAC387_Pa04g1470 [Persea americana]